MTPRAATKKKVVKKKAVKKKAAAKPKSSSGNLAALTRVGVIPAGYSFTASEKRAIDSLSKQEIATIVSARKKLGSKFIQAHAPHGFLY